MARQTTEQRGMDEVRAAHLLAVLAVAIVEAHYAVWEAKYFYHGWRPETAIRTGAGPLHLTPQPAWQPLLPSPLHPEYPCAHCSVGAAAAGVLERTAGLEPLQRTVTDGSVTRHYTSFRQFADEEAISRIYAGVHFRWSNEAGSIMGRQVSDRVIAFMPKPLTAAP